MPALSRRHLAAAEAPVNPLPTVMQVCATLGYGGSERVAFEAAYALQQAGGRSIIAGSPGGLVDEIIASHIKFVPLPTQGYNPFDIVQNIGRLQEIIRQENVDVIHIHNRAPGWSAYAAARLTRTPIVSTYHSAYGMGLAAKRLFNSVMARADRVIVSSNYIGGYMDAHHGSDAARRMLIRNGIDLARFDPARISHERVASLKSAWKISDSCPVFIMPARLTRLKGHTVVIEAAAELISKGTSNFLCLFVGGDEQRSGFRDELEALASTRGLCNHIRFTGPYKDMPVAYAVADFALSASIKSENISLARIEASAMGLPVITTSLGAAAEVVLAPPAVSANEQTGWIVPPQDPLALAQAMREALSLSPSERERLGQRARAYMLAEFDEQAGLARTLDVYRSLWAGKQRCSSVNAT